MNLFGCAFKGAVGLLCLIFVTGGVAKAEVLDGTQITTSLLAPSKLDVVDISIESKRAKSNDIIFYRAWLKPQNTEIKLAHVGQGKWVGKVGPFKIHGLSKIEIEKSNFKNGKLTTTKYYQELDVKPELSFVEHPRITNVERVNQKKEIVIHGLNFSRQSKVKVNGTFIKKYRVDGPNRIRISEDIKKTARYTIEVIDTRTRRVAVKEVFVLDHEDIPIAVVEFPIDRHPITEQIILDASKSYGGDQPLKYHWQVLAKPEGSQIDDGHLNQDYYDKQATFLPDKPGFYLISLIVASGSSNSYAAYAGIHVFQPADLLVTTGGPIHFLARVGTEVKRNITLKNISNSDPLDIDCIQLEGDEAGEISGIPDVPLIIAPGKKLVFPLTYKPKEETVTQPDPTILGYTLRFQCGGDPANEKVVSFDGASYPANPLRIVQSMGSSATDDVFSVFDQQHFTLFPAYDLTTFTYLRMFNDSDNDLVIYNMPEIQRAEGSIPYLDIKLDNIVLPIVVPAHGQSTDLYIIADPLNFPEATQGYDQAKFVWDPDLLPIDPNIEFKIFGRKLNSFGTLNPNPSVELHFTDAAEEQVVGTQLLMSLDENGIPTNEYGPGLIIPSWQYVNHIDVIRFVGQGKEDFAFSNYIMPNGDESYMGRFEPTYDEGYWFVIGIDLEGGFIPINTGNRYGHFNIHFNPTQPASYYDVRIEMEIRGSSQRFHVPITVNSALQYKKGEALDKR